MATKKNRSKAQELADEINKLFGEDTIRMGSDPYFNVEYLPTGVLPFDVLLEGGLPRGRFTEIYGAYSTLKSYIGLRAIATTQAAGGVAALIDTEHAYDPKWAESQGVDTSALLMRRPESGEEAMDIAEVLIRSKEVDLIVFDSVHAATPQAIASKRLSKETIQPARLAALMSEACRKLTTANEKTAVLWINQTRINVGVMFGDPETTPGGRALPFYSSYRICLRKAGKITVPYDSYDSEGKLVKTKMTTAYKVKAIKEKSKLNAPQGETLMTFDLDTGQIDELGFMVGYGLERGYVVKSGHSYALNGSKKKTKGVEAFKKWLVNNPEELARLRSACLGVQAPAKKKAVRLRRR